MHRDTAREKSCENYARQKVYFGVVGSVASVKHTPDKHKVPVP